MSFLGPNTRSRNRAATKAKPKSNSLVGESIVSTMTQPEIANKLSELKRYLTDLKGHVILGQPMQTLVEAEHLANLKEAVSTNTPNLAQQKLEAQLQSVIKNLETLATTQQTNAHNVAAYNMSTRSSFPHNTINERHH